MSAAPSFRVLPWDFFANDNEPPPHIEALQISGAPREFELQRRGSRVYFRLHGDNSRAWATLDDDDNADFVRTFRRAIGSGRIGRVFDHQRGGFGYERNFYFSLLMNARGEVQAREWCATRWFTMEADSPKLRTYLDGSKLGVFHPKWKPPFREILEEEFDKFYEQPFDEADRALTIKRWVRGDPATLEKIVAPFVWRKYPLAVPPHALTTHFFARGKVENNRPVSTPYFLEDESEIFPKPVKNLLADCFQVCGVRWQNEHEADVRKCWELLAPSHSVRIATNPTAHERLEAHLFLRAWLAGKLTPTHVAEILSALSL